MNTLSKLTATFSLALLSTYAQAGGSHHGTPTPTPTVTTYSFTSGAVGPEAFGNSLVQVLDGVTLTTTAWSTTGSGNTFQTAELEIYSGYGMGVCNRNEGVNCSDTNSAHALDNNGADDLILFSFSGPVQLDSLSLMQFGGDSDLSVWAGTGSINPNGLTPAALGTATLIGGNYSNGTRSIDLGSVLGGNYTWLAVAARIGSDNDYAKLRSLTVDPVTAPIPEAETWAIMRAGLGLLGFAVRRRT